MKLQHVWLRSKCTQGFYVSCPSLLHFPTHSYMYICQVLIHNSFTLIVQGNQTCTTLGNDLMPGTGTFALYGLLINTVDTTNCMGNATAWNICYYNATSSASSTTQFGVYRPSSLGSTVYAPVPGSAVSYTIARGSSTYACSKYSIPQAQQFVVRYGDVIYACIQYQLFGGSKLGVVGNVSGHSVLHSNLIGIVTNPCASLSNTINVSSGYTNLIGYALHVSLGQPVMGPCVQCIYVLFS